ncbi:hypothetical protein PI124_g7381 [Phytophthora idaei]|nr:hypothetical protein PI124_g7381 [Phytophthora idaei]
MLWRSHRWPTGSAARLSRRKSSSSAINTSTCSRYASSSANIATQSDDQRERCVFSGIQPTGTPHLGNYCGAIAKWVALQESSRTSTSSYSDDVPPTRLYSVVDLHALTVPFDAQRMPDQVHSMVAALLGAGLDPTRNILFRQSDVAAHAELAWLLSCITPLGWLQRMTQFKHKAAAAKTESSLGLLSYPVLMAADILLYRATHVPVGEDQQQHLELTRMIATTFNDRFGSNRPGGKEVLPKPFPMVEEDTTTLTGAQRISLARIMSLRDPTKKMSKSDKSKLSRIELTDSADDIRKKVRKATTDAISGIYYDREERPGVSNLLDIASAVTGQSVAQLEAHYADHGTGAFKNSVADAVIAKVCPIGERIKQYEADHEYIDKVLADGAAQASELAAVTMQDVKEVMGLTSRGLCLAQGLCSCPNGWSGPDCSLASCPLGEAWSDQAIATDNGHNLAPCSNRGECELDTGTCTCDSGFTGAACERITCTCNGHGSCKSMAKYALMKDPGRGTIYPYDNNWDAHKIYGCVCDPGYTGSNCVERLCPVGDDPLTGTLIDPNGIQRNEKQRINCKATSGSFTLTFAGYTTEPISADDSAKTVRDKLVALPSVTAATVTFGGITLTACTAIGNDISIEFTQDFGDLPNMSGNSAGLVHSTPSTTPTLTFTTVTQGTKENLPCSRRGMCDPATGVCMCYPNYFSSDGNGAIGQRGDCGFVSGTVTACPGEIACSGKGTCRGPPTYDCICNEGFTGGDCTERLCPKGRSWFDRPTEAPDTAHALVECSNAGECDRTKGECVCLAGFTGAACNRMVCPNDCSGHGTCYTMEQLAKRATVNGETMAFTYGAVPNKKETWEYDMVQGCLCSPGWEGHDCSLRSCPTGDDPMTLRQQNEVQLLVCKGNSGFFTLKFRDAATPQLPFNVPAASLASALEALATVGKVSVTYSTDTNGVTGSPACNTAGSNIMRIDFLTNFGDLPPLRWILDGALTLTISVDGVGGSVRGTKEDAVCSNRGICSHLTGVCRCTYGFTSSDGFGSEGDRGDCGYMEPIYITSAAQQANAV